MDPINDNASQPPVRSPNATDRVWGPLARLIDQVSARGDRPAGGALWQRLDMERIARRVIQTARIAAAERLLHQAGEAIRQRDALAANRSSAGRAGPGGGEPATT